MENEIKKTEQQQKFEEILSRYNKSTQNLYFSILKMYSDKGSQTPKSTMKNEILDKIKEAVK